MSAKLKDNPDGYRKVLNILDTKGYEFYSQMEAVAIFNVIDLLPGDSYEFVASVIARTLLDYVTHNRGEKLSARKVQKMIRKTQHAEVIDDVYFPLVLYYMKPTE